MDSRGRATARVRELEYCRPCAISVLASLQYWRGLSLALVYSRPGPRRPWRLVFIVSVDYFGYPL